MTSSDQLEMINLQELKRTKKAKEETKERATRFSLIDLQEWNTMYIYFLQVSNAHSNKLSSPLKLLTNVDEITSKCIENEHRPDTIVWGSYHHYTLASKIVIL